MSTIESTETNGDEAGWVDEHREELAREADSEGPHAWVAQRVLVQAGYREPEDEEDGDS